MARTWDGSYPRSVTIFATGFLTYLALIVAIGAQTLFLLRQIVRRDRVWTVLTVCFVADVALLVLGAGGVGVVAERWPWLVPALTVAGVVYLLAFAVGALRSAWRGDRTLTTAAADVEGTGHGPDRIDLAVLTGELPLIDPATGRLADREPAGAGVGRHDDGAPGSGTPSGGGSVAVRQCVQPRRVALDRPQTPLPRIILLALSVSLVNPHAILDTVVMMGTFAQTFGAAKWAYVGGAVAASLVWFAALGWGGTKLAPSMDSARTWRIVDAVVGVLMLGIAVKVGLTLL